MPGSVVPTNLASLGAVSPTSMLKSTSSKPQTLAAIEEIRNGSPHGGSAHGVWEARGFISQPDIDRRC